MLRPELLEHLRHRRCLLAFSGGGDSTALFFLLEAAGIPCDLALVNYHTRPQSDEEARYAETLAARFDRRCFLRDAHLDGENFEHEARGVRYAFFDSLIQQEGYEILLTAHQLDDRLEWLLMQLCKGAGMEELLGMRESEPRRGYTLVRPLLHLRKTDLLAYLTERGERWYEDASNADPRYLRNGFRHNLAAPMLERCAPGIARSFAYLDAERERFEPLPPIHRLDALLWFQTPAGHDTLVRTVDRALKEAGFLMRRGDRESLGHGCSCVVGRRFAVAAGERYCFIAPYADAVMPKPFKERCRTLGIDPKLRPYLFRTPEAFTAVASLLGGDAVDLHGE